MAYVIAAPCIADYSCVDICPVDCISPRPSDAAFDTAEQLYIDPRKCVNCGACVDICPASAIFETSELPARWAHYADINRQHFETSDV